MINILISHDHLQWLAQTTAMSEEWGIVEGIEKVSMVV